MDANLILCIQSPRRTRNDARGNAMAARVGPLRPHPRTHHQGQQGYVSSAQLLRLHEADRVCIGPLHYGPGEPSDSTTRRRSKRGLDQGTFIGGDRPTRNGRGFGDQRLGQPIGRHHKGLDHASGLRVRRDDDRLSVCICGSRDARHRYGPRKDPAGLGCRATGRRRTSRRSLGLSHPLWSAGRPRLAVARVRVVAAWLRCYDGLKCGVVGRWQGYIGSGSDS